MGTKEFIEKVKNNEIDIVEHTYKLIEECKEINKECNYLNTISEELALDSAREIKIQLRQKNGIRNFSCNICHIMDNSMYDHRKCKKYQENHHYKSTIFSHHLFVIIIRQVSF